MRVLVAVFSITLSITFQELTAETDCCLSKEIP